jgi:hypothetical protein
MARKTVDVAVIIPDAGPILTLAGVERLELLTLFDAPVTVVDQVIDEVCRPANDPDGRVAAWLAENGDRITIVETFVRAGFLARSAKNSREPKGGLGELAVEEYAITLSRTKGPSFIPLVLFEDPDVLELKLARLKSVHLLNTAAWLLGLDEAGIIADGRALLAQINAKRTTPMQPFDSPARTKRVTSQWITRTSDDRPA